ncbi:hypothetical protein BDN72DRAFT_837325 [Pluteus cervinus]|uniref:Uncharacterized protein n=1 Tax=Pluteus cervinus TaxID=181527 RepID=A0ACD3B153_9AGAR|nr:hypothetical protein BDN72DRAFT_837325 [Pluteus cervinus]
MSSQPINQHFHLFAVIQQANERYRRVAREIRQSLRPTLHAQRRALCLGLVVDIQKADNCPQRQISVQPLPIIDTTPSPNEVLTIRIPAKSQRSTHNVLPKVKSALQPHRPTLQCSIPIAPRSVKESPPSAQLTRAPLLAPRALRGQDIPWRGPTSRWSVDLDDDAATRPFDTSRPDVPMDTAEGTSPLDGLELQYPTTAELHQTNSSASFDTPSGSISSGSSSRSSSMLLTPDEAGDAPVMSRSGKRKAVEDVHFISMTNSSARHPKFARKEWVVSNDMHI